MKTLNVVETAYRATLEEQDDTIVWLTHAMKGAGGEIDVLLRGNAVCYVVKGQDIPPLAFGARQQKMSPRLSEDVAGLISKGASVFVVSEDLAERGIDVSGMIGGRHLLRAAIYPSCSTITLGFGTGRYLHRHRRYRS